MDKDFNAAFYVIKNPATLLPGHKNCKTNFIATCPA